METNDATIDHLCAQKRALAAEIEILEATAAASSTPGIREFRRTRLRQLEAQFETLSYRLRRLDTSPTPEIDAHTLGTALRDARLVAQGTFGR